MFPGPWYVQIPTAPLTDYIVWYNAGTVATPSWQEITSTLAWSGNGVTGSVDAGIITLGTGLSGAFNAMTNVLTLTSGASVSDEGTLVSNFVQSTNYVGLGVSTTMGATSTQVVVDVPGLRVQDTGLPTLNLTPQVNSVLGDTEIQVSPVVAQGYVGYRINWTSPVGGAVSRVITAVSTVNFVSTVSFAPGLAAGELATTTTPVTIAGNAAQVYSTQILPGTNLTFTQNGTVTTINALADDIQWTGTGITNAVSPAHLVLGAGISGAYTAMNPTDSMTLTTGSTLQNEGVAVGSLIQTVNYTGLGVNATLNSGGTTAATVNVPGLRVQDALPTLTLTPQVNATAGDISVVVTPIVAAGYVGRTFSWTSTTGVATSRDILAVANAGSTSTITFAPPLAANELFTTSTVVTLTGANTPVYIDQILPGDTITFTQQGNATVITATGQIEVNGAVVHDGNFTTTTTDPLLGIGTVFAVDANSVVTTRVRTGDIRDVADAEIAALVGAPVNWFPTLSQPVNEIVVQYSSASNTFLAFNFVAGATQYTAADVTLLNSINNVYFQDISGNTVLQMTGARWTLGGTGTITLTNGTTPTLTGNAQTFFTMRNSWANTIDAFPGSDFTFGFAVTDPPSTAFTFSNVVSSNYTFQSLPQAEVQRLADVEIASLVGSSPAAGMPFVFQAAPQTAIDARADSRIASLVGSSLGTAFYAPFPITSFELNWDVANTMAIDIVADTTNVAARLQELQANAQTLYFRVNNATVATITLSPQFNWEADTQVANQVTYACVGATISLVDATYIANNYMMLGGTGVAFQGSIAAGGYLLTSTNWFTTMYDALAGTYRFQPAPQAEIIALAQGVATDVHVNSNLIADPNFVNGTTTATALGVTLTVPTGTSNVAGTVAVSDVATVADNEIARLVGVNTPSVAWFPSLSQPVGIINVSYDSVNGFTDFTFSGNAGGINYSAADAALLNAIPAIYFVDASNGTILTLGNGQWTLNNGNLAFVSGLAVTAGTIQAWINALNTFAPNANFTGNASSFSFTFGTAGTFTPFTFTRVFSTIGKYTFEQAPQGEIVRLINVNTPDTTWTGNGIAAPIHPSQIVVGNNLQATVSGQVIRIDAQASGQSDITFAPAFAFQFMNTTTNPTFVPPAIPIPATAGFTASNQMAVSLAGSMGGTVLIPEVDYTFSANMLTLVNTQVVDGDYLYVAPTGGGGGGTFGSLRLQYGKDLNSVPVDAWTNYTTTGTSTINWEIQLTNVSDATGVLVGQHVTIAGITAPTQFNTADWVVTGFDGANELLLQATIVGLPPTPNPPTGANLTVSSNATFSRGLNNAFTNMPVVEGALHRTTWNSSTGTLTANQDVVVSVSAMGVITPTQQPLATQEWDVWVERDPAGSATAYRIVQTEGNNLPSSGSPAMNRAIGAVSTTVQLRQNDTLTPRHYLDMTGTYSLSQLGFGSQTMLHITEIR